MADYFRLKIRGFHLDNYGFVNNVAYHYFLEEARWSLFEDYKASEIFSSMSLGFVQVSSRIDFRKPAVLGDELEVHTKVMSIGKTSCQIDQVILYSKDNSVVLDASNTYALVDLKTKSAIALQGEARDKLEQMANVQ